MDDDQQTDFGHSSSQRSDALKDEEDIQVAAVSSETRCDGVRIRISTPHGKNVASRASIQQLPLELFIRILHLVLEDSLYDSSDLKDLCLVCNDWHRTIRLTPSLWTLIDDAEPLAYIKDALRLSGNALLRIRLTGRLSPLFDLLIPHSHRWNSLDLAFSGFRRRERRRIASLLTTTTPSLAHISLSTDHPLEDAFILGDGGALRSLCLSGASMAWESPRLSGLTRLCLNEILHPPSLSRLVGIIQASPNLAELVLSEWHNRDATSSDHLAPLSILAFPNLRRLTLSNIPLSHIVAIVTHIQAPTCSTLALNNLTDPDCGLFRPCKSGFTSLLSQVIAAQAHLQINIHAAGITLFVRSADDLFQLSFFKVDVSHSLSIIATLIASFNLKVRLSIEILTATESFGALPVGLLDVFPPTVETLGIPGEYKYLLEYLARPKRGPSGAYGWPCPALRELRFKGSRESKTFDGDAVLKFLSGRWGKTNLPEGIESDGYHHPRKLDNLRFVGFDVTPAEMQAIRGIGGDLIQFIKAETMRETIDRLRSLVEKSRYEY
ncbi:hypothetical protein FRB99_001596 [Tulasnella sp. 403]|nr:hypothetical protein FRB99_001596 [Tulasnella sp. 403]